jgi:hypothetical protein
MERRHKSKKKRIIISIFLPVLLIGGGATGWILYQNEKIPFLSQENIKASAIKVDQQKINKLESSDQQAKDFIAEHHDVLNDLTGWSAIEHPDWPAVQEEATAIKNMISTIAVKDSVLKKDFQHMEKLAKQLEQTKDQAPLKELHRYFHDLDVVINEDDGSNTYFNVTSYGKSVVKTP